MADETIIRLTDEQKQQLKEATGQEHDEFKVETVGSQLSPRVTPKRILAKKHSPKVMAKKAAPKVMAKKAAPKVMAKKAAPKKAPDADIAALERELGELLSTRVAVQPARGGSGKLVIQYHSLDELEGILERIRR